MSEIHPAISEAVKLFKVWEVIHDDLPLFPVNCEKIAEGLGIKVHSELFEDKFVACLMIDPDIKAIIYNQNITNSGRKNFTIAHEIGHYSLHRNLKEIKCSIEDLGNIGGLSPHSQNIEREANVFASRLLMPSKDFRGQILGEIPSIGLSKKLRVRYDTSHMATAYRLLELTHNPTAVLTTDSSGKVKTIWKNQKFSSLQISKSSTYKGNLLESDQPQLVQAELWGLHSPPWILNQSALYIPSIDQFLIILTGETIESLTEDKTDYLSFSY